MYTILFLTAMGWVGAIASPDGIARITLPQESEEAARARLLAGWRKEMPPLDVTPILASLQEALCRFYDGEKTALDQPLDLSGHPSFFRKAWEVVRQIPWGSTLSYGEVARLAGRPCGARAVGMAMANNPVPPLVPCHRVLRGDGSLGGFGGGLELKARLLRNEGIRVRRGPCEWE